MKPPMNRCCIVAVVLLAAACTPSQEPAASAAQSAAPAAAAIARAPDGTPDLNGIWQAITPANWNLEAHAASQGATDELGAIGAVPPGLGVVADGAIPYLPDALAQRDANFAMRRTEDPEAKCYRPGVPRATYMPQPFQVFQTPDEIFITYQFAMATRSIVMKEHAEAPFDSWMGWSNGHWEGDTLVVEVTGLNGQAWLDRAGNFISAGARVVERYTPQGPNHLLYEATIEDAATFSRPWTLSLPLYRLIDADAQLLEFKCVEFAEELVYGHLSKGATTEGGTDDE